MDISYKNTNNPHLKIINEKDIDILKKIINKLLIGNSKNIKILNIGGGYTKENEKFMKQHKRVDYFILDIQNNKKNKDVILGDITDSKLHLEQTFDLIYSADTFEHILNPWDATKNIKKFLNNNGFIFCKAPFSWRYHACPFDTYRYTHTGMRYIFEYLSQIRHIQSGYKRCPNNNGWYADKTDVTLDGKPFTGNIETYYIGQKDETHVFDISEYDKGWKRK